MHRVSPSFSPPTGMGNAEIYRMKTDGTEATNLTGNPASDQMAKGSPDGAFVVFTTNRDGNQEVYSMRIDGVDQANQTNNPSNDFRPSWAPSQAWIAFTTDRDGNREVYITKPGVVEECITLQIIPIRISSLTGVNFFCSITIKLCCTIPLSMVEFSRQFPAHLGRCQRGRLGSPAK